MDNGKPRTFDFGPFHMDLTEHQLFRDGKVVPLTPKNFDVLRMLVENAGHLVQKEDLLKEIWPDTFVEEANLNRSVSLLRKVLGEGTDGVAYIETIPKRGYRFVAAVREPVSVEIPVSIVPPGEPPLGQRPGRLLPGVVLAVSLFAVVLIGVLVASSGGNSGDLAPVHRKLTSSGKVGAPAISSDGKYIAYVSYDSPQRRVMMQERKAGAPVILFVAPEVGGLRWSPDGAELLFWARGESKDGLYVVPRSGGNARKVMSGTATACWSPDGSTLAVVRQFDGRIHFLDRLGKPGGSIRLEGVGRWIFDLDWSPTTDLLLFVNDDRKGNRTISTIRPDGTLQEKIIDGLDGISAARWTARGDAIYFMRQQNQTASLYRLTLSKAMAGTHQVPEPLLTGLETQGGFGVSADGKYLVYDRAPFSSNLWSVRVGNKGDQPPIETRQLTQGTSLVERPSISPDGKHVVYSQGSPAALNLYTIPIEGGVPTQLTFRDSLNLGAVWSPEGRGIAFASNEGGVPQIWIVPTGGGPPQRISTGEVSDNYSLSWSPGRLLYQRSGNQNFYVVDFRTQREHLLLEDNRSGWVFNPVSSPGGGKIAAAWSPNRKAGLYILEPGKPERLVTPGGMPMLIGWAAGGDSLYALDGKSASSRGNFTPTGETTTEAKIVRYPLDGSPPQTLVELPFEEIGGISISPDGKTLVCAVYVSSSDVWVSEGFDRTLN